MSGAVHRALLWLHSTVASLLPCPGEYEKARVRVEPIIRKEHELDAFEILELMCDLLHERSAGIKMAQTPPAELAETLQTLIWATPRVAAEITELRTVLTQLQYKYGSKYLRHVHAAAEAAAAAAPPPNVPEGVPALAGFAMSVNGQVLQYLRLAAPPVEEVSRYLRQVAEQYGVGLDEERLQEALHSASLLGRFATAAPKGEAVPAGAPAALSVPEAGEGVGGPPAESEEGDGSGGGGGYSAGYDDGFRAALGKYGGGGQEQVTLPPQAALPYPPGSGGGFQDPYGASSTPGSCQPYPSAGHPASQAAAASTAHSALAGARSDLHAGASATPGFLPTGTGQPSAAPYPEDPTAAKQAAGTGGGHESTPSYEDLEARFRQLKGSSGL